MMAQPKPFMGFTKQARDVKLVLASVHSSENFIAIMTITLCLKQKSGGKEASQTLKASS
jgi:hypothetical protein